MTSQLVSETKVITMTKHMLKCDVPFLKYLVYLYVLGSMARDNENVGLLL